MAHSQTRASSLKKELEALQQNYQQGKINLQTAQENLDSLRTSHKNDVDEQCRFLSLLLEQVRLTIYSVSPSESSDSELESSQSCPSTSTPIGQAVPADWPNLSKAVDSAVLGLCDALKRSRKEAKSLKSTAIKLKSALESTRAVHKETTCKLTLNHEEQETQWNQRNEQMKAHFEALLVEAENKALNFQQRLDGALQDVAHLTQSKQQLESQLKQLRETHRVYKNDRACLLSCTCLLAGSLFPALTRLQQLSIQKAVLLKQLLESEKLHDSAVEVVNSIQDHIGVHMGVTQNEQAGHSSVKVPDNDRNQPQAPQPLLKFRKAVIVILATNRFRMMRFERNVLFQANFPRSACLFRIPVHLGLRDKGTPNNSPKTTKSTSPSRDFTSSNPSQVHSRTEVATWMRSEKALVMVRESFTQLQSTLDSCTAQHQERQQWQNEGKGWRREKGTKNRAATVLHPAKSAFESLLEKMGEYFPNARSSDSSSIICSDGLFYLRLQPKSLCYRLAQGLRAILKDRPQPPQSYIKSSEVSTCVHSLAVHALDQLFKVAGPPSAALH